MLLKQSNQTRATEYLYLWSQYSNAVEYENN